MAQTYLNDNKSMPYPFFGYGSLPFSMACVVGLGVCIRGDEPIGYGPIVASSVAISEGAVNMAIGRMTPTNVFELIGTVYATTAGYSVYVPAEAYTTFGDGSSIIQTLERLLARWAGELEIIPGINRTKYVNPPVHSNPTFPVYYKKPSDNGVTVVATGGTPVTAFDTTAAATSMAVFYKRFTASGQILISTAASSGYMVVGTIPQESVGLYDGPFALDPSCSCYMPDKVFGHYTAFCVNGFKYPMEPVMTLEAGGLLGFDVTGTTATLTPTSDIDNMKLSHTASDDVPYVTALDGVDIKGTTATPDPTLFISNDLSEIITWEWARWSYPTAPSNKILTLELNGTTAFPNCYGEA